MSTEQMDLMHFSMLKNVDVNDSNYKFIKCLPEGGCALVHLYTKLNPNEDDLFSEIIVKRLKTDYNVYNLWSGILFKEFSMGQVMDHPNVLGAFDLDVMNMCIAFPYFNSVELCYYMEKENRLSLEDYISVTSQIINGVEYLHNKNIAHMDLKPENILYNVESKQLKIIDFGVSKIFSKTQESLYSDQVGTCSYWSPEQHKKVYYYPPFVDMWCIGLVFFELYYKRLLWKEPRDKDVSYKYFSKNGNLDYFFKRCVMKSQIENPGLLDGVVKQVVSHLVVKSPEKRWSISRLKEEWEF